MKTTPCPNLPRPPNIIRAQCPEVKATASGMYPLYGFPYYIPFLSDYLWKLNNALFKNFSWMYMDLVDFRAVPELFTFGYDASESYYCMRTYSITGVNVSSFESEKHPEDTCMAVDSSHNVYYVDEAAGNNVIRKRDKDGTLVLSKDTTYSSRLCMSPDGYVCEMGLNASFDPAIIRRNATTLNIVDDMTGISSASSYEGFTCDADGYFYMVNRGTDELEKWDFGGATMVASHSIGTWWSTITRLAVVGSVIAGNMTGYVWTMPTTVDTDATRDTLTDLAYPKAIASIENGAFLVGGYDSPTGPYVLGAYTSTLEKVWAVADIPSADNLYGVAAYPF